MAIASEMQRSIKMKKTYEMEHFRPRTHTDTNRQTHNYWPPSK